jgi:prolyl-tRNA editing enzyme YbaK/EbsC (Cys-tRNA(Pro) deacylase)
MTVEILDSRVRDALEKWEIAYEVVECDPEFADTAEFCAKYDFPFDSAANAILVAGKKEPDIVALCLALATTRLDVNHKVCEEIGVKRASFASPELTKSVTGMMIGGVTPFGVPDTVPLLIDAAVAAQPWVIVGGGNRSSKLKVEPAMLSRLPNSRVVTDLAISRNPQ